MLLLGLDGRISGTYTYLCWALYFLLTYVCLGVPPFGLAWSFAGKVTDVYLLEKDGRPKGSGFVTLDSKEGLIKALALDDTVCALVAIGRGHSVWAQGWLLEQYRAKTRDGLGC